MSAISNLYFNQTGVRNDEDIRSSDDTNTRHAAEPELGTSEDAQQARIRDYGASSNLEKHEARSVEPAVVHLSVPDRQILHIHEEDQFSAMAISDQRHYFLDCARISNPGGYGIGTDTRGDLYSYAGDVSVGPREVSLDGRDAVAVNLSTQPYLVFGLLSGSTGIPKEVMIRIQSPTRLFEEIRKAASKLRPWPIRMLSLKSESGFGIYECTDMGIHKRVQVDQNTSSLTCLGPIRPAAEMS